MPPAPQLLPDPSAQRAPLPPHVYQWMVERAQVALCLVEWPRVRSANPAALELLGYGLQDLLALPDVMRLVAPHEHRRVHAKLALRARGVHEAAYDVVCVRKDGSHFNGRISSMRFVLDGHNVDIVTLQDVTAQQTAVVAAEQRAQLLAETEALARLGSCEYDVASGTVKQSAGMYRLCGEPVGSGPVSGEWLMSRVPPTEDGFVRGFLASVRPGEPCEFEHRLRHADGSLRTVLHRCTAEADADGVVHRVIGIVRDITDQRAAEHQRDALARTDGVTRLPNRVALLDHLDGEIRQALHEQRPIALLHLGIDQLKRVSDSFGFAAGDALLVAAAERLRAGLQPDDMLAHLGSGRFAVLLARRGDVDAQQAVALGQSILQAFDQPFPVADTEVQVRCAIGVTVCPRDGGAPETLLHRAQTAMHRAVEKGGHRVCLYAVDAHARAADRLSMEAALRQAIERGGLHVAYQPQIDLHTGQMVGVEALLRWTDPVRGPIGPDQFIPLAEETGLILPLGDWVLRRACEQNAAWQQAGLPPLRMAVNLSVKQLQQPDIVGRIEAALRDSGLAARWLGIEMTESVMMVEGDHVADALHALRALGIEISIDDFGTGYSNLSSLRKLPIDVVKVDRSLVHDVTAAAQDVSMTRAVINLAHSLQLRVLAEGVETEGQLALLIANRCDQMQGYLFSRPVAPDAIAAMLLERRQMPPQLLRAQQSLQLSA